MPSETIYGNYANNGLGYRYWDFVSFHTWDHSPRAPDGSLKLRANTLNHDKKWVRCSARKLTTNSHDRRAIYGTASPYGSPVGKNAKLRTAAINRSYGMLVKHLRGDNASLGVTLASWKQSLAMIVQRSTAITKFARKCEKKAARQQRVSRRQRRKRKAQGLRTILPVGSANLFLEGMFGWLPLISDVYQAIKAMTDDVPGGWISGHATVLAEAKAGSAFWPPSGALESFGGYWKYRVKQTCFVQVTNPNVWLANKLGVINPALVVWDLVPWSFVAGWFANFQQILGSMTDFAGLTVSNASTTQKWETIHGWTARSLPGYDQILETCSVRQVVKTRELGLKLPSFQTRIPKVDMGFALISVSLMVQQIGRLKFI